MHRIFNIALLYTRRLIAAAFLAALMLAVSGEGAWAQTATVTALTGQSCAGTRAAANLGCTANDFTSTLSFTQPSANTLTSCVAGQMVLVDVIATVTSGSTQRYDGAYFLGEVGNSPSLNDASKTCSLGVFPTAPLPFKNVDGDSCGDFSSSSTASLLIRGVSLKCTPAPGTNLLAIPYTLVFDNSSTSATCTSANITAGTSAKCSASTAATITGVGVQGFITLTKQTNPDGAAQLFGFTASASPAATPAPASFSLADNATQTVSIPLLTSGAQSLTLTETLASGWDATSNITCTNPAGGSAAAYVTINNAARSITANLDATNYGALCTITNTRLPTLQLTKISNGGTGAFSFSGDNGFGSQTITTVSSGASAAGAVKTLAAVSAVTVITETIPAGYALTAASCTGIGTGAASVNLGAGTITLNAAATAPGNNVACTFTNAKLPTLQLTKLSIAGAGAFSFSGDNGFGSQTITTLTPGASVAGAAKVLAAASAVTVITETIPAGYVLTAASCTGIGAGAASVNLVAGTVTLNAAATAPGNAIACTFTNRKLGPSFSLAKAQTSGPSPIAAAGAVLGYTITLTNTGDQALTGVVLTNDTITTGAGTSTLTPVYAAGDANSNAILDIGEAWTFAASYAVTQADMDAGGSVSNAAAADTAETAPATAATPPNPVSVLPALSIDKTANIAANAAAGQIITYTYKVTNSGNVTINAVTVNDTHNGTGTPPVPGGETFFSDGGLPGGSTDAGVNGAWDKLAPGDAIIFTATYQVTQQDVDTLQ